MPTTPPPISYQPVVKVDVLRSGTREILHYHFIAKKRTAKRFEGNYITISNIILNPLFSISMKGNWLLAGSMDETISLHNLQKSQNLLSMECGDRVISVDLDYKIEAAITNQADGSCIYWDISFQ